MRQEFVRNIIGTTVITDSGPKRAIGNAPHRIGDSAWVDGGYVLGHERRNSPGYVPSNDMFRELSVSDGMVYLVEYTFKSSGIQWEKSTPLPDVNLERDNALFPPFLVYNRPFNYIVSGVKSGTTGTIRVDCIERSARSFTFDVSDVHSIAADAYVNDNGDVQTLLSIVSSNQHVIAVKEYVAGTYNRDYASEHLAGLASQLSNRVAALQCLYRYTGYQHYFNEHSGKYTPFEVAVNNSKFGVSYNVAEQTSIDWSMAVQAYYDRTGIPVIYANGNGYKVLSMDFDVRYIQHVIYDSSDYARLYGYFSDETNPINPVEKNTFRRLLVGSTATAHFSTEAGTYGECVCHGDTLISQYQAYSDSPNGNLYQNVEYITQCVVQGDDAFLGKRMLCISNPPGFSDYYGVAIISVGGTSYRSGTIQVGTLGPGGLFYDTVWR